MKKSKHQIKKQFELIDLIPNFLRPFHLRSDIQCHQCGRIQKQPIDWVGNFRVSCQYGCDNEIFHDGSGQCAS